VRDRDVRAEVVVAADLRDGIRKRDGRPIPELVPGIDSFSYFYTLFMTPLFLFSGIFFPVETLPKAVAGIAWFTPLYHLVNVCRAFAAGHAGNVIGSIVWIVVVAAALAPVPFRLMRRRVIQ
jgi:lipooligosaccharide transport system permease protein